MRLRTQFAFLTAAVTLVPILYGVFFFGAQQAPRDPRVPTRSFMKILVERWRADGSLEAADLQAAAEESGLTLREAAVISPEGDILVSTFAHLRVGGKVDLTDLAITSRAAQDRPRPELNLMQLDYKDEQSPLLLLDIQPFWSKQDLRNRNVLLTGSVALGLFAVAGILSLVILRSISRAIKTIDTDTAIVATGDLDHKVTGSGSHEILSLANSINLMRLNLKDMLARRSRMFMGISHDLKTPIALIQGYADALADEVASDSETRGKYLDIIRSKARQLEDLVAELLDFLKIGGDGGFPFEGVDLGVFLKGLGARFASDAELMHRKFFWGFGEEASETASFPVPVLPMNRGLAERAIENLVANSFKYSSPEGEVSLRLLRRDGKLAFSVTDEGPGIPEDDKPYVFDAFFRGSTSRSDGGHGLGLTIVKAAAEIHGWKTELGKRPDGRTGTEVLILVDP